MMAIDRHEEELLIHSKNLDILATNEDSSGDEDVDGGAGIDKIFKAISEKNLSQCTVPTLMRLLHTQINCIASDITRIKKCAASEKCNAELLKAEKIKRANVYKKDIERVSKEGMQAQIVSLEQALLLVSTLAHYKAENMILRQQFKEMQNQIQLIEMQRVTEVKQMMDLRPENTPEDEDDDDRREVKIQNGMSITLDNEDFDFMDKNLGRGSMTSIAGGKRDILDEIFAIEAVETATKLQASHRQKLLEPLDVKKIKQHRKSIEEKKGAERKDAILEVIQEVEQDRSKPVEVIMNDIQQRKYEKLENEQLLNLLTASLKKIPSVKHHHIDDEGEEEEEEEGVSTELNLANTL